MIGEDDFIMVGNGEIVVDNGEMVVKNGHVKRCLITIIGWGWYPLVTKAGHGQYMSWQTQLVRNPMQTTTLNVWIQNQSLEQQCNYWLIARGELRGYS